jgi:hypothetical protein
MDPDYLDDMSDLSAERRKLFSRLQLLSETISEKMYEFSHLMKEAEAANWENERTARADSVFDEGIQLNKQYKEILAQIEDGLSPQERVTLEKAEEEDRFRVEEPSRFLRKDLSPELIPQDETKTIEDSLERGLDHLLAHLPSGWMSEQKARLALASDAYLRQPLILTNSRRRTQVGRCTELPLPQQSRDTYRFREIRNLWNAEPQEEESVRWSAKYPKRNANVGHRGMNQFSYIYKGPEPKSRFGRTSV